MWPPTSLHPPPSPTQLTASLNHTIYIVAIPMHYPLMNTLTGKEEASRWSSHKREVETLTSWTIHHIPTGVTHARRRHTAVCKTDSLTFDSLTHLWTLSLFGAVSRGRKPFRYYDYGAKLRSKFMGGLWVEWHLQQRFCKTPYQYHWQPFCFSKWQPYCNTLKSHDTPNEYNYTVQERGYHARLGPPRSPSY